MSEPCSDALPAEQECALPGCTKRFVQPHPNKAKRYCSRECGNKAYALSRRTGPADDEVRSCVRCGKPFKPRSRSQTRCSFACRRSSLLDRTVTIYVEAEFARELEAEAKRLNRSVSWIAQRCVRRHLSTATAALSD